MTSSCAPYRSWGCGTYVCPIGPYHPAVGQSWDDYCRECERGGADHQELMGDCDRDEALVNTGVGR